MSELTRFDNYIHCLCGGDGYSFAQKQDCNLQHIKYMLNRTQSMFKWNGLPETIPERNFELMLQINGNVGVASVEGLLYAFCGGLGGEANPYYMPTLYTVANPALKLSKNYVIDDDIIIIPNDTMYMGLIPMFERYAKAITETELSIELANINSRIISLISAGDDKTKASAEKYIEDIIKGKPSVIGTNAFLEGVKTQPYATTGNSNIMKSLIELEQYLKASWYNELGLNANYNMKREALSQVESQMGDDNLLPYIDGVIDSIQTGLDEYNELFGYNIRVKKGSAWQWREIEEEEQHTDEAQKEPVEGTDETA